MDCHWEATAPTKDELMKKITEHASNVHNIKSFPPDMVAKMNAAIKP
jgi:predicted small metal-binding protein